MNITASLRLPGSQVLLERFPDARPLWSFEASPEKGFVANPFTLTAYSIDGRVVILQEFKEHGWDVYLPASDSIMIADVLDAIAQPTACLTKKCSYYQHYLAYGPAELEHEGYHAAERICAEWQKRASDFFDAHPSALEMPEGLKRCVAAAEARVRA